MNREYDKWHSKSLNKEMELLVFGHAGARVIIFPTSCGHFYDWENRGLIEALRPHLENGWIQLYFIDSVDEESWWNTAATPTEKAKRHLAYQKYVVEEVLPYSKKKNDTDFVIAMGASMGAYHAINIALRYPKHFQRTIGLSGPYDMRQMADPFPIFTWIRDYYDDTIREADPVQYIRDLTDEAKLKEIREVDIIFAMGKTDPLFPGNQTFTQALWDKEIWHAFRVWEGFAHDWPYWYDMVQMYIGGPD